MLSGSAVGDFENAEKCFEAAIAKLDELIAMGTPQWSPPMDEVRAFRGIVDAARLTAKGRRQLSPGDLPAYKTALNEASASLQKVLLSGVPYFTEIARNEILALTAELSIAETFDNYQDKDKALAILTKGRASLSEIPDLPGEPKTGNGFVAIFDAFLDLVRSDQLSNDMEFAEARKRVSQATKHLEFAATCFSENPTGNPRLKATEHLARFLKEMSVADFHVLGALADLFSGNPTRARRSLSKALSDYSRARNEAYLAGFMGERALSSGYFSRSEGLAKRLLRAAAPRTRQIVALSGLTFFVVYVVTTLFFVYLRLSRWLEVPYDTILVWTAIVSLITAFGLEAPRFVELIRSALGSK